MRKNTLLILLICAITLLSSCNNTTVPPSFTDTVTPDITVTLPPSESETDQPSQTQAEPSQTFETIEPSPTVIPPNSTYIDYYDLYIDLTVTDELSREQISWGEKSNKTEVMEKYNVRTSMDAEKKEIYLTFNLGYEHVRGNTEKLLELLKQRDILATFFLVGEFIEIFPEKVKAIYDDGHTLGAHSYYHIPPSYTMTDEEYIDDFIKTEKLLEIALKDDYERMRYYRPIIGEFCERDLYIAQSLGYTTVLFDATYSDWNRTVINGAEFAYNELIEDVHEGAVYQLHIVTPDNIEALPVFLDELINDGWTFKIFE